MNGEDLTPSTYKIMSMSVDELKQVYLIRDEVEKKNPNAFKACHLILGLDEYLCDPRQRKKTLFYINQFITEIERYRPGECNESKKPRTCI